MKHLEIRHLLRYISGNVDEKEQVLFDTHLAECPSCRERARSLFDLGENFDTVWSRWSAADHGHLCRQLSLARAMEELGKESPSMARQIKDHLHRLGRGADVAVKVLVDRGKKVASMAKSILPTGLSFTLQPAVTGVGAADELLKLEGHINKSSEYLYRNQSDEAVDELLEACRIDARCSQAATSRVFHRDKWVFQFTADSRRGRVSVRYQRSRDTSPPAFALLLSVEKELSVRAAPFQAVEETSYLLAEFENIPSGAYRIEIIPSSRSE